MFSSISSKTAAAKPLGLSQSQKTSASKSKQVFWQEVGTAASAAASKAAKTVPRQNSVAAKTLPVPQRTPATSSAATSAQTLAARSLTNRSLPTSPIAQATPTPVSVKATSARPATAKAAEEGGGTVTTPTTPTPPVDPADAVRKFLTEMGYDASKFRFEAHEEFVSHPNGGYMHRFTSVDLPNGMKENFTTDLMGRFPSVTANELARLMENRFFT
jgi:hypothetical protein